MVKLWYFCDGDIEKYKGQVPDWKTSFVVCGMSEEKAIINVIHYRRGRLGLVEVLYRNKPVRVIPMRAVVGI